MLRTSSTSAEVQNPYLNINEQLSKSLDFTLRYRQDLGRWGRLSLLGQATYQLKDRFTLFQGVTTTNNGRAGDPKWVADFNLSWKKAPFTFTYGLNIIAATNDIKNLRDVGGSNLTADNCLATDSAFALRGGPYCPIYKLPRVAYHSLSAEVQVTKDFSFLVGVSNLFDKKPPLVVDGRRADQQLRTGAAAWNLLRLFRPPRLRQREGEAAELLSHDQPGDGTTGVGGQRCSPTLCFGFASAYEPLMGEGAEAWPGLRRQA